MRGSFLLIVCCCASALNGGESRPVATTLQVSDEKILTVPSFAFFEPAQSDSQGNIFIHPPPFEELNILRITPSSETRVYKLPDTGAQKYSFHGFSVTPNGTVWAVVYESGSPNLRAVEFDSRGDAKNPIRLDVPDKMEANGFIALDSGVLLVSGYFSDQASAELRGGSFLGLFDGSGKLLKGIRNGLPSSNTFKVSLGTIREGACTSADDGNAYFLGGDGIVAVSPTGEISKQIHFKKPASSLQASRLYVSNGWAAIRLVRSNSDNAIERSFLILELATGNVMGWYKLSGDADYSDVSFSPNDGFTFYANDHGKLKLLQAKLH